MYTYVLTDYGIVLTGDKHRWVSLTVSNTACYKLKCHRELEYERVFDL